MDAGPEHSQDPEPTAAVDDTNVQAAAVLAELLEWARQVRRVASKRIASLKAQGIQSGPDYELTQQQWEDFDWMVAKIEATIDRTSP